MKNHNWWFISFYILLSTFIFYELLFLLFLLTNHELKALYHQGFVIKNNSSFHASNYFSVFYLPVIGAVISCYAFASFIVTDFIFRNKSANFKFYLLIFNFILFVIGFFLNFTGELFYSEWSNSTSIIVSHHKEVKAPNDYYYWLSSSWIWSIFGWYFGLLVGAVILLIKLNIINIQTSNFYRQRVVREEFIPELKQPLPSSSEFDPNETQTITIFLDDDEENYNNKKQKKLKGKNFKH